MIAAKNAKVATAAAKALADKKVDWKTVKLGEVADVRDGTHSSPKETEKGTLLVTSKNLIGGILSLEKAYFISDEDATEINKRSKVDKWDVLFTMIGTVGEVAIIKDDPDFVIKNVGLFKTKGDEVLAKWIYYYFRSSIGKAQIQGEMQGTTQQYITLGQLRSLSIPLPPLPTQRKIAAVLRAIDDKIENNRKICANLEVQAQALFKSWFVDFEPFGGKMPKDWKMGKLGDVVESMINGDWGKDKSEGKNNSPVYCIRGADIPAVVHGEKGKMPLRYILPQNYQKKELVDGNIVVEISGGSPTQSTGRAALITQSLLMRYNRGLVCTNFCKAIKPIKDYSYFLYFYWRYLYDKGIFFQYENGTTGIKNLDINGVLSEYSIALPDSKINNEFNFKIKKCVELIFQKGHENEKLAELRDALLPKLMSGELDVDDVEV